MRTLWLSYVLTCAFIGLAFIGCKENPTTNPDSGPPACQAVGCPHTAFCNRLGDCNCPQADGGTIECRFYDAGVP